MKVDSGHGGQRTGAGRPNLSGTPNHMKRPEVNRRTPLLITLQLKSDLPSLKGRKRARTLKKVLEQTNLSRCRVQKLAIQSKKISMILRSEDSASLAKMMQSFSIRFAKTINRLAKRKGPVFHGRYSLQILRKQRIPPLPKIKDFLELSQELPRLWQSSMNFYGRRKILRP